MDERKNRDQQGLSRRRFLASAAGLAGAAAAGGLAGLTGRAVEAAPASPAPLPKRTLGRTGLKVTAFSLGAIGAEVPVFQAGLARGINFIHCAMGYGTLDKVAQTIAGRRNKLYLGLKYERPGRQDWDYLNRCLNDLKVDGVDILFFPLNSPDEARNREHLDFFKAVQRQKKARFIGITSHGNMAPTMQAAVEAGFWDVLMPSYPPGRGERAALAPVLDQAEKKKLGVVAMKTMGGINGSNLGQMQTVLKEVLADSSVSTLVKGTLNLEQLQALLAAVGQKPTRAESEALEQHLAGCLGRCTICGKCPVCPNGVNVFEVVKAFDYYYATQGCLDYARKAYAQIPPTERGGACQGCGACTGRCPYGVNVAAHVQASELVLG